jgi:hypothetical protein
VLKSVQCNPANQFFFNPNSVITQMGILESSSGDGRQAAEECAALG